MRKVSFVFTFIFLISTGAFSANDAEVKKSYLEDIFIWKMSDELKLTAKEEKEFTEIHKALNKKKSDLNKEIQKSIVSLNDDSSEEALKKYKKLLLEYNQISISEFDSLKKLLGSKKFISYLKIKSELTSKVKSILIGEKIHDKKDTVPVTLPPPKVVVERGP